MDWTAFTQLAIEVIKALAVIIPAVIAYKKQK